MPFCRSQHQNLRSAELLWDIFPWLQQRLKEKEVTQESESATILLSLIPSAQGIQVLTNTLPLLFQHMSDVSVT